MVNLLKFFSLQQNTNSKNNRKSHTLLQVKRLAAWCTLHLRSITNVKSQFRLSPQECWKSLFPAMN